jgi:hypothetical protein
MPPSPTRRVSYPCEWGRKSGEGKWDEEVQAFGGKVLSIEVRRGGKEGLTKPRRTAITGRAQKQKWSKLCGSLGGERLARDEATRKSRNSVNFARRPVRRTWIGPNHILFSCLRSTFIPADQRVSRKKERDNESQRELEEY